jgi:hypothetical protein
MNCERLGKIIIILDQITKIKHTLDFSIEELGYDIVVLISRLNPRAVVAICDYNSQNWTKESQIVFHASLSQTLKEDNILQHEVHDHPYFVNSKIQATPARSQLSKILKE